MPESGRDECTVDEALERNVGEFGRGQLRIYLMVNLVWLITALQVYSMLFVEWNPLARGQWQCTETHSKQCKEMLEDSITVGSQLFCRKESQWKWTNRGASIVSEFELACDQWKVSLVRSVFFLGQLLGSGLFGYLADKIGRQRALVISATISGFSTATGAFSPNFWAYLVARALTGFGSGGQMVASFVLWTEFVGPSKRGKLGIAAQLLFAAGECLLFGLAWLLPAWRRLSLAIGLMSLLFILVCTWIPESPRWLLVKGRKGEATSVLAALACANRTKLPEFPLADVAAQGNTDRMLLEVLQLKRLRKWLLIVLGTWFSVCGVFHAPVLMLEPMSGNNDFSFLLMAIIEVPLYGTLIFLVDSIGRKPLYSWGLMAGGTCCFLIWILPQGLLLPLAIVGKLAIAGAFAVAFPYTTETFFTSVRASTLGVASMFGRIGSSIAPMIATSSGTLGGAVTLLVLGVWGLIAGFLALDLPETMGMPLPDSIEDTTLPLSSRRRGLGANRRKNSHSYLKIIEGEASQS